MRCRTLVPALLAAAVAASGCGERAEPLGELAQPYPVRVEGAGDRPTVLRERPDRIVALSEGSADLLAALGTGDRLVGGPGGEGATAPRIVLTTGQIDVEAVVELAPDLIVATPSTDPVDLSVVERETGAAVYVQPASSVDAVQRATVELGFLVGEPVAARRLVARIERQVAEAERRVADASPVTVFVDLGFFQALPERSLLGDLVRRAHGRLLPEDAGPDPVDPQELARLDPDVYLATSDSRVTLAALRRDPRTRDLEAVRDGRFAVLPVDLVMEPGPRVGEGLAAVARALHPDAFRA